MALVQNSVQNTKSTRWLFQDPAVAVALVVIGGVLVFTVFLPKMHTISQQSRYRKLKLLNGSDSTVYTTFRDHPLPPMYYPTAYGGDVTAAGRHQSRSRSRYSVGGSRLLQPTVLLPPLPTAATVPPGYGYRFNGLNFLAAGGMQPPPYSGAKNYNNVAAADWSREHSPGGTGYYHSNHLVVNPNWRKVSRLSDASSSSKKSKLSEQKLLASSSSLQRPAKKGKKSSLLGLQQQRQVNNSGLLLQPDRLDYDENARVYHITP
jgi:hypothetical protein